MDALLTDSTVITPEITVSIPPVYMPFPLKANPALELVQERGVDWMARHGFCGDPVTRARIAGNHSGHLFGYSCPRADPDRLQLVVDWTNLTFAFDDLYCDTEITGNAATLLDLSVRVIRTLKAPSAGVLDPNHPFTAPMIEVADRLHRMATPAQIRRQIDAHLDWFTGSALEVAVIGNHGKQSVNDHLTYRLMSSAAAPSLTWIQLSEPDEIPEGEFTDPAVQRMTEVAGATAALDNDLCSYGKEQWYARHHRGDGDPFDDNIVNVYRSQHRLETAEAMLAVVELRDRLVVRFMELWKKITPTASDPLRIYAANLACLIRGNFQFSLVAPRYSNPDGRHPGAVRIASSYSDRPSATGAPGIPTLDWCWD